VTKGAQLGASQRDRSGPAAVTLRAQPLTDSCPLLHHVRHSCHHPVPPGPPAPEVDHPREDRRLEGNPLRTTWNHFTNASGEMNAGIWACEKGSWRIAFALNKDEYFCVLEGRAAASLTNKAMRPKRDRRCDGDPGRLQGRL
jgi:uncharacterized cupin superfamily protein